MTQAIVVTATDTDVGKTVFSAGLVRALDGCYWKPVQAGLADGTDSDTVRRLAGLPADRILPEAYRLETPASPHHAAAIDNVVIDPSQLVPPPCDRRLVIEGAGGLLVPLAGGLLFADIFARWRFETVVVARTALGTINHSLLTIEALRARDIPILGIAFVGDHQEESERTIAAIGGVRRLGRLPRLDPLGPETLAGAFAAAFSTQDFAP
ncbi:MULTISPECIES: dethiobiotin synthase [unclassified Sphingomonas]|uniref:dethiobiotin synthase n=1 Tax=unclassified Sphingomonas TaxID=196159 RepID=UPI0006F30B6A|nr:MULTISPECIES: dethiobiotin synthase [unclassified Sphingomonas]KQX26099.1 dethiobiotin synthetase [Sphingomonas sp. Root1294]KQY69166.1 dethiobiotin synthetase [Sphingomonas sp. Root50]KRB89421.1 dethiobiotin synthetase [Sphingomonas sp. Root720]